MEKSNKFFNRKTCLILIMFFYNIFFATANSDLKTVSYSKGFSSLFGESNIKTSSDDTNVNLHLNQYTGSGFRSSDLYSHGFFSARIKLPSEYTAGIVVAFYTTNGDIFEKTHDELDFEFLGNIRGKAWRFQTNIYGNGSTSRGREERYRLWFDPSKEFHRYSILWTTKNIIFYIDDVPIREITRNEGMGGDYPSKPMALYATIWDASDWATSGGKYKTNYKYAPFVAQFTDLALHGCAIDPIQQVSDSSTCNDKNNLLESSSYSRISHKQREAMRKFRQKYMYYSYCYDTLRYSIPPPECVIDPLLKERFKDSGRLKFDEKHNHHRRSSKRSRSHIGLGTSRKFYGNENEE